MRQETKEDKLYVTECDTDICEGYLRHMKRCGTFPKRSRMLAVAFGHEGKLRICNAIGYMKTIREASSLNALPEAAAGEYNLVAVYYVAEHLDDGELPQLIQHVKRLLLPDGSLMAVVDLKKSRKVLKSLRRECEALGFSEVQADHWRSEPLNHWDRLTDKGRPMASWMQRIPLLRRWRACSVSMLFTEGSVELKQWHACEHR